MSKWPTKITLAELEARDNISDEKLQADLDENERDLAAREYSLQTLRALDIFGKNKEMIAKHTAINEEMREFSGFLRRLQTARAARRAHAG